MELLTLQIIPLSHFGTIPKGDTIFGQIVAYFFLNKDNTFENYLDEEPKLIVSDMMPYGYVHKPNLPLKCFKNSNYEGVDKKEIRKKKFISLKNLQKGDLHLCEKVDFFDEFVTIKNSINRTTFTTDGDNFAPYGINEAIFHKKLWLFILVESTIKDKVLETLSQIGKFGFGKDGNLGKGNFEIKPIETPVQKNDSNYVLSISPIILQDTNIAHSWYEPFTRFGKYGLNNAHTNAFKKPTLMADSATVAILKNPKLYFGSCLNNGVENKPSFLQGYSIAIPFKLKDISCLNID
jgi:CRISPR-associated protein Csm4